MTPAFQYDKSVKVGEMIILATLWQTDFLVTKTKSYWKLQAWLD